MILTRDIAKDVLQGAKYFPVVALLGPRQSGKTTLAQVLFKQHKYVSLEDPDIRAAAQADPRTFLLTNAYNAYNEGIIIDEFQHVPVLLSYIQTIVDKEQKPGYFILTGSQNFLANQAIAQSLAGRISIHTLLQLSIHELKQNNVLAPQVETVLYNGCYPAIYAKQIPPELLYRNYFQTYIERDVRQLAQVGDLATFQTFVALCASRIGQLLNLTQLGNECGISNVTAKRWLSILEASYIVFTLHPYHTNFGKRLVKTPKIYFYDTGLVCFLLNIKEEDLTLHSMRSGLFESFIIADILKWQYNYGKRAQVYFWRDKTGHEIDCIVQQGNQLLALEVKASRTTSPRFFEGLQYWSTLSEQQAKSNFVIYAGASEQPRGYSNVISWQLLETILEK